VGTSLRPLFMVLLVIPDLKLSYLTAGLFNLPR
jgi:hypothetical protein